MPNHMDHPRWRVIHTLAATRRTTVPKARCLAARRRDRFSGLALGRLPAARAPARLSAQPLGLLAAEQGETQLQAECTMSLTKIVWLGGSDDRKCKPPEN